MNYLFHLYLSDPTPECLLGNLMGDFVKGPLDDLYTPGIRHGLRMHRQVDTFAHTHKAVRSSKKRIASSYGHCRSIMVDVFYDHLLATHWEELASVSLSDFSRQVYSHLESHYDILPPGLQQITPNMIRNDWLGSYRQIETIERVLQRISTRLQRPNSMGEGIGELTSNYDGLKEDFSVFLEDAAAFTARLDPITS